MGMATNRKARTAPARTWCAETKSVAAGHGKTELKSSEEDASVVGFFLNVRAQDKGEQKEAEQAKEKKKEKKKEAKKNGNGTTCGGKKSTDRNPQATEQEQARAEKGQSAGSAVAEAT